MGTYDNKTIIEYDNNANNVPDGYCVLKGNNLSEWVSYAEMDILLQKVTNLPSYYKNINPPPINLSPGETHLNTQDYPNTTSRDFFFYQTCEAMPLAFVIGQITDLADYIKQYEEGSNDDDQYMKKKITKLIMAIEGNHALFQRICLVDLPPLLTASNGGFTQENPVSTYWGSKNNIRTVADLITWAKSKV